MSEPLTPRQRLKQIEKEEKDKRYHLASTRGRIDELIEMIKCLDEQRRLAREYEHDLLLDLDRLAREKTNLASKLALEPDFEDPRFVAALRAFEQLPGYDKMFPYQREAIAIMLYRKVCPYKHIATGFIEGDDTGLGKTAVTAMVIRTLESMEHS